MLLAAAVIGTISGHYKVALKLHRAQGLKEGQLGSSALILSSDFGPLLYDKALRTAGPIILPLSTLSLSVSPSLPLSFSLSHTMCDLGKVQAKHLALF